MTAWESIAKELFSGVMGMGDPSVWMMFLIGGILIYLGVKKDYEPMLLFPMGVGCIFQFYCISLHCLCIGFI